MLSGMNMVQYGTIGDDRMTDCTDYEGNKDLAQFGCMYCDHCVGTLYRGKCIAVVCLKGHTMELGSLEREEE